MQGVEKVKVDRPARKGDLIAYQVHRSYVTQDYKAMRWSVWRLGVVESASRAGVVRKVRQSGYDTVLAITDTNGRTAPGIGLWAVAPRSTVDMAALMADEDLWGQDLEDLAEVRAALQQYKVHAAS